MVAAALASSYPVDIEVQPVTEPRNKLTVAFRMILVIPQALLVGSFLSIGTFLSYQNRFGGILDWGVLGAVAVVCAIIAWFAILFADKHPEGLRNLSLMYLRWRVRVMGYSALFRDEYPPFGDSDDYPARLHITPAEFPRDKVSVGLRLIYALPHLILLFFLHVGWLVTSIIAWFAILINGTYPQGLYNFGIGVFRWSTRVEAYTLLLVDEYPPFSLD